MNDPRRIGPLKLKAQLCGDEIAMGPGMAEGRGAQVTPAGRQVLAAFRIEQGIADAAEGEALEVLQGGCCPARGDDSNSRQAYRVEKP